MHTIDIMPTADHGNVPPNPRNSPPMPEGWLHGCIPLAAQRKGPPVAITPGVVTFELTVASMRHRDGCENGEEGGAVLHVSVEQLVGGAWKLLHRFEPMRDPITQRAMVMAMGEQLRTSHYFARQPHVPGTYTAEVAITWGLTLMTPALPA